MPFVGRQKQRRVQRDQLNFFALFADNHAALDADRGVRKGMLMTRQTLACVGVVDCGDDAAIDVPCGGGQRPHIYPAKLSAYVTFRVSPETTERSPGAEKSAAENSVPVVPSFVLLLTRKAPPTVAVASMLNEAAAEEFEATEGLASVAATNRHCGRVALL